MFKYCYSCWKYRSGWTHVQVGPNISNQQTADPLIVYLVRIKITYKYAKLLCSFY